MSGLGPIKEILTVLPIAHVLAACFFLFGYCTGFGHHLIAFVGITDIFLVSIRSVGLVYVFLGFPALPLLILILWRRRRVGLTVACAVLTILAAAAVTYILTVETRPLTERATEEIAGMAGMLALAGAWLVCLFVAHLRGALLPLLSARNIGLAVAMLFVMALALGHNKGVTDEGRSYADTVARYFLCGRERAAVIRSLGAHYLVRTGDLDGMRDGWALVDERCSVRFRLDPVPAGEAPAPLP